MSLQKENNMATLVRARLREPETTEDDRNFATEVARQLGYHPLAGELQLHRVLDKFAEAASELQIDPFTAVSVHAYKAQKIREYIAEHTLDNAKVPYVGFVAAAIWVGIAAVCCVAVPWWVASVLSIPGWLLAFGTLSAVRHRDNLRAIHDVGWRRIPLKEYDKPVPAFALQTALDLQKSGKCRGIEFFVEELYVNTTGNHVPVLRRRRIDTTAKRPNGMQFAPLDRLDPFLVAKLPGEFGYYYLEVWNEPGYKQTRQEMLKKEEGEV